LNPIEHIRGELQAILAALNYIYSIHTDVMVRQHLCVEIVCNSVYCANMVREWIHVWAINNFQNRTNVDLLAQLLPYVQAYQNNIKIKWVVADTNEMLLSTLKFVNTL
jgi:ribonuclease HI